MISPELVQVCQEEMPEAVPVLQCALGVFDDMKIAEEEIAKAMERYPDKADLIWSQFLLMQMPPLFYKKTPALYRHHCAELLDRVGTGSAPLDLGTRAEVLAVMIESCMRAPLRTDATVVCSRLFLAIFPDVHWAETGLPETYDGAADELYTKTAKKIGVLAMIFLTSSPLPPSRPWRSEARLSASHTEPRYLLATRPNPVVACNPPCNTGSMTPEPKSRGRTWEKFVKYREGYHVTYHLFPSLHVGCGGASSYTIVNPEATEPPPETEVNMPKLIIGSGRLQLGTARARVVIRPECKHIVDVPGGRRILSVPELYAEAMRRLLTYECHSYALENTYGGVVCYLQKLPDQAGLTPA